MKKTVVLVAAIFAVFALTGIAMAQDRVEVKVVSEPIGFKATCDKAGSFSLEFDSNTSIVAGDQITIDLSFVSPTDNATICRNIDLEISPGGDALNTAANRWNAATVPAVSTSPVYVTGPAGAVTDTNNGIYFRVRATAGTQRITIDVLGDAGGSIKVGADPTDKLIMTFLDQKTNAFFTTDGVWKDGDDVDILYNDAALLADNTLCINVFNWSGAVVKGSMDSNNNDKYTFIPSDPQIAHIAAATQLSLVNCAKADPGRVICGSVSDANGVVTETCNSFDFETGAGYYERANLVKPRLMIQSTSAYVLTNYQIQLEILVNGLPGDNGVYFSNDDVEIDGFDNSAAACNAKISTDDDALAADLAVDDNTYYNAAGSVVTPADPSVNECDVATGNRAVKLVTGESNLSLDNTSRVILVDLPRFNYDLGVKNADDVVTVRVTLIKAPCGSTLVGDLKIGTMCAASVTPPNPSNTVLFPYFSPMDDEVGPWQDGIAISNLGTTDGLFTAVIYEQDGDVGSYTGTVKAKSLFLNTLGSMLATTTLKAGGTGDGILGNKPCYVVVCTNFMADGFAFLINQSSNTLSANESMGYIPRVTYDSSSTLPFCTGVTPGSVLP